MEEYVNRSGASVRNALKWYQEEEPINLSRMAANETRHMSTIEKQFQWVWTIEDVNMFQ